MPSALLIGTRIARAWDVAGLTPTSALALVAIGAYVLHCLHTMYLADYFAFHDLGLTNDYLANTVNHGLLFYAAELHGSHLAIHFSPALILITPLYALTDSQFVLLVVATVAFFAAVAFMLRTARCLVPALQRPGIAREVGSVALAAALALNVQARTVLTAAHFEPLYMLGAAATFDGLLRNARWRRLVPLLLLTLGVREDAGIHLVGPLLATLFVRPVPAGVDGRQLRRKALVLSAIAVVYVLAVVFVVLPLLGPQHAGYVAQFWGSFGRSPLEVVIGIVLSPLRVLREIAASGFHELNLTFGYVAVLNPVVFVLTNLSGIVFYIAGEEAKKYLWYYNSAFLLPGMALGLFAGLARLSRITNAATRPRLAAAVPVAIMLCLLGLAVRAYPKTLSGAPAGILDLRPYAPVDHRFLFEAIDRHLIPCRGVQSVAADFVNIVFFPNRYEKYLLLNFPDADEVFLVRNASEMQRWGMNDAAIDAAIRRSGAFTVVASDARLVVYRKKTVACGPT
jgi:uncharacterized membrane protein